MKGSTTNNLFLIIGDDHKLIDFYLQDVLSKLTYNEESKITYDLTSDSFVNILDEASMISLFSNQKLIIGTNFDLNKLNDNDTEYLKKYLNNQNKDIYIILITSKIDARRSNYKLFKENFKIIDTTENDPTKDLRKYLKKTIEEKKYHISDYDIDYFLAKVGNDINNINTELTKLFIYKEETKEINAKDIDLLIADNIDNIVYEFTNAIIENDYNKMISMYNNFKIQNVSFDYLLSILANNFHQLLIIKLLNNDGKSNAEIAKIIGKKEFYVKKNLERLYGYTTNNLSKYITNLATIDSNFKTGKANIDELELFLLTK